jgi:DNA invertase Pin-like site-specific DNA recombinase
MVDSCHWREVGVSRSAANNWARGHKTYRCGEVGFVPALDRLAMRQVSPRLLEPAVDFVIVHKLDRLARDRADDVAILLDIRRAGATLVSVSEQIDESPAGTLMHGIVASFAEFYSKNLSAEARKGLEEKVRRGGTPGQAPIGYLNVTRRIEGTDVKSVTIDDSRAPHIQWAFREYATGE